MEENLEQSEWMKGIKETGFTTPSNYFEELNGSIKAKIAVERLKAVVPQHGYAVPEDYFKQLQSDILAKTIDTVAPPAKPGIFRLWQSNFVKYASAACFVILAGTGVYFNSNNQPGTAGRNIADAATEQMLFDIDEEVIIEHIEANYSDQQKTSTKEAALENYILNNYTQSELTTNL